MLLHEIMYPLSNKIILISVVVTAMNANSAPVWKTKKF